MKGHNLCAAANGGGPSRLQSARLEAAVAELESLGLTPRRANMVAHTTDLLNQSDQDLFTKGGCHVFAVCLAELFAYPLRLLRDTSVPYPGGIVHVYCLPASGVMIDFHGRGSERAYRRSKCYDFSPYHAETVPLALIKDLSVDEFGRGGLYAEPHFVEIARSRAFAAIAAGRSKYDYDG